MNIKEIVDSLHLIYYSYDVQKKILVKDSNYSNQHTESEFFKITYYLSKYHIQFNVLKDKSISFNESKYNLKKYCSRILEKIKNSNKNIYLLNNEKVKWAKNIPLFKIIHIKKEINLDDYDALIFTSKNAVHAIEAMNKDWKKLPAYVMSEQTAKLIKDFNAKLAFISKEKHGNEFAHELLSLLKGKKVLYLRGKEVVSDLIDIFAKNGIDCRDEIIYENKFNQDIKKRKIPKNSKIIFTSPSTVKYFLQVFSWDESYTAISIGKTTAQYFPNYIEPVLAEDTSFQACINKALSIE